MNVQLDMAWTFVGFVTATVFCSGLLILALAPCLRQATAAIVGSAKKTPVRVGLAGLAIGFLVSYAGTKPPAPTTYTVKFELPLAFDPIESFTCETGKVFCLPKVDGYRWRSSANDRLYDGGLLVFDLAKPGETVTMTAMGE